jgi:hypothetical protein
LIWGDARTGVSNRSMQAHTQPHQRRLVPGATPTAVAVAVAVGARTSLVTSSTGALSLPPLACSYTSSPRSDHSLSTFTALVYVRFFSRWKWRMPTWGGEDRGKWVGGRSGQHAIAGEPSRQAGCTDLAEVTRVELVHQNAVVVLPTGVTAATCAISETWAGQPIN